MAILCLLTINHSGGFCAKSAFRIHVLCPVNVSNPFLIQFHIFGGYALWSEMISSVYLTMLTYNANHKQLESTRNWFQLQIKILKQRDSNVRLLYHLWLEMMEPAIHSFKMSESPYPKLVSCFPQEVFGFVAVVLFCFSFSVSNSKWALYGKSLHVSDYMSRRYFSEQENSGSRKSMVGFIPPPQYVCISNRKLQPVQWSTAKGGASYCRKWFQNLLQETNDGEGLLLTERTTYFKLSFYLKETKPWSRLIKGVYLQNRLLLRTDLEGYLFIYIIIL